MISDLGPLQPFGPKWFRMVLDNLPKSPKWPQQSKTWYFRIKYFSVLWIMCYWKFVKVSSIKGWRRTLGAFSIIHLGKFPPPAILQTFLPPFVHFVFLLFFSLICIHYEMYLLIMSNIFPLATILQTFLPSADLHIFVFV